MTTYFNKNYYPTPAELIKKMVDHIPAEELKQMTVLEPSAGMGAIADFLKYKVRSIDCIEIDDNMAATLKGKQYKVVHNDFLSFSGAKNYDAIIMNPPFDAGANHLLKAIEIMRHGHIVCLLNAETLKNQYSQTRQRLAFLIEHHGGAVEYLDGAFAAADRKTGVEVALVKIYKKSQTLHAFSFQKSEQEEVKEVDLTSDENGLYRADFIAAHCDSYNGAAKATENLFRSIKQLDLFASVFMNKRERTEVMTRFFDTAIERGFTEAHNGFIDTLQQAAWTLIFQKTKAQSMTTTNVRQDFEKWRKEQGGVDMNEANVTLFFEMLFSQKDVIRAKCIEEAFELITRYSDKNRQCFDATWKTNSHYMVGKKFILWGVDMYGLLDWKRAERFDDIDRALCMVSGRSYENIKRASEAVRSNLRGNGNGTNVVESEFFKITIYKKGTLHFEFLSDDTRMQFNRAACAARGWQLPEAEQFKGRAKRK
jgi:predicted RNA methylase